MTNDRVSAGAYVRAAQAVLDRVITGQADGVARAADLIVASLRADGVLQAFGTGHSEALCMEIAGRAGGLVPSNRIVLRDVVVFGGESPSILTDPKLEREPGLAPRLYELAAPRAADVFVIASNSGVNGAVVEMALLVKERGHDLIAITSAEHTARVASRHPSGRKLADVADVVLDNGAPYGDALLRGEDGNTVCAVSSITAAMLAQMIVAEVVRRLGADGGTAPVYRSVNVPDGDQHNQTLEARYAGRIRRTA